MALGGALVPASGQGVVAPGLTLSFDDAAQTATATWFGEEGVPYQLESSDTLRTWADAGEQQTGHGSQLSITLSTAGRPWLFFRLKQVPDFITASFAPATGVLTVTGEARANTITVSRDAGGALQVNGGEVPIIGGTPTTDNTSLITILGGSGDDVLSLDETHGPLPPGKLSGEGGDDIISGGSNSDELIGGPGKDSLLGRGGADRLFGGEHNDTLIGGGGDDQAFGEAGDDRLVWNPVGDGNDTVEGGENQDSMVFNGSAGNEIVEVMASGPRVRLIRNVGSVVMDLNEVETLQVNALGGADTLAIHDLSGTHLRQVMPNLSQSAGGSSGDGAVDTVIVNGTAADDDVTLFGNGIEVAVFGLHAGITIRGTEIARDRIQINGLDGDDTLKATHMGPAVASLSLSGGIGADTLLGSEGDDRLDGGEDHDFLDGNQGYDLLLLGAGDDTVQWDPGDGRDIVEGQAGSDTVVFNGSFGPEIVEMAARDSRLLVLWDMGTIALGAIALECDGMEHFRFRTLGGADYVLIGDLSGTDASDFLVDLATPGGTGDGAADHVTFHGTANPDTISVTAVAGAVEAVHASARLRIQNSESSRDSLDVNGLGGVDTLSVGPGVAALISVTLNQGD